MGEGAQIQDEQEGCRKKIGENRRGENHNNGLGDKPGDNFFSVEGFALKRAKPICLVHYPDSFKIPSSPFLQKRRNRQLASQLCSSVFVRAFLQKYVWSLHWYFRGEGFLLLFCFTELVFGLFVGPMADGTLMVLWVQWGCLLLALILNQDGQAAWQKWWRAFGLEKGRDSPRLVAHLAICQHVRGNWKFPILCLSYCKALYLRAETFQRVSIHMHISAPIKAFPFEIREDNHVFEMSRYSPATFEIFIFFPLSESLTVCITVGRNHGGICIYAH